jgi:hypothetical protein
MANVKRESKFDMVKAWTNLAQSYRLMASVMVTSQSRDRLLRMAETLEIRCKRKMPHAAPP